MLFTILYHGEKVVVGSDILSTSDTYDINTAPTFDVTLPIRYLNALRWKVEIVIEFDDGRLWHGILVSKEIDKKAETIQCNFDHVLSEWSLQCIPINVAKKKQLVSEIMKDKDIIYNKTDWTIAVQDDATVEYEFSRENKLEALEKIVGMTDNLSYRLLRDKDRVIQIGKFGEHKNLLVTKDNILDGLTISDDATNIINYAVSLSDKTEGGATSVTLKEVHDDPTLQDPEFPVIITGNKINTQAPQIGFSFHEYAPNNVNEYAVLDETGIERENGDVYEGTFSTNDVQPIQEDGKTITNEDRIMASKMLYQKAIRKLRFSRRNLTYQFGLADLPVDINVGDKIKLVFKNNISYFEPCNVDIFNTENVLDINDWFYITSIQRDQQSDGTDRYNLTVAQDLVPFLTSREV